MPITRAKKTEVVKTLTDKIKKSNGVLFGKFHGVSVARMSDLRRKFRGENIDFTVAKKTLIKIAFKELGKEIPMELEGEVGMAAGYGDALVMFKTASDFAKKEKGAFEVIGGFFDGRFVDSREAKALGLIPSREVLLAQLMGVIQGNTKKLVYLLDQIQKQKSS